MACAYCGKPAANLDHVIPKALRKHALYEIPLALAGVVPACFDCNNRKGTRMLVPPSWANRIPALKDVLPGPWRIWSGSPLDPAFRDTHV
jgi:5-methylcytosine-specific restriction endonuclease McrA